MKLAYADPPYIGCSSFYPENEEVDHKKLIKDLGQFDGWALSTHSPGLKVLLPLCPDDVRIGAWVKPFCSFKKNVNPAYAWEPVIFWGGRKRTSKLPTLRDWVSVNMTTMRGVVGAKPETFCFWIFEMLGATRDDEFFDIYPGSGAVTRAWNKWVSSFNFHLT